MPNPFFRIEMLPAKQGDALWIEYGCGEAERRILIDGGPINAYPEFTKKIESLPEGEKGIELLVISHIDTDHIEGIIRMMAERRCNWQIEPKDIWFNGWRHMNKTQDLGGREGEFLSALISRRANEEWNKAFNRGAVMVDPKKELPIITLEGGIDLTLLSPNINKLRAMAGQWKDDIEKWSIEPGDLDGAWDQLVDETKYNLDQGGLLGPGDFTDQLKKQLTPDPSKANGSSIAFLAEYESKRCLFLADAHMDVVCESIKKLIPTGKKQLEVDAVKVSHHGSRHNIKPEFFDLVDAQHFLISSNGDKFEHPDKSTIESIIKGARKRPTLWFNYRSKFNEKWESKSNKATSKYDTRYPQRDKGGICISL